MLSSKVKQTQHNSMSMQNGENVHRLIIIDFISIAC